MDRNIEDFNIKGITRGFRSKEATKFQFIDTDRDISYYADIAQVIHRVIQVAGLPDYQLARFPINQG